MSAKEPVEVQSVTAELRGVRLPFGLVLDSVKVTGQDVRIDRSPIAVSLPEPGDVEVTVTDLQLQAFLEKKSPGGLRDFFVQLSGGQVHVHATARVIVEIRAVAICRLKIVDGKKLVVELEKVDVLGVGAKRLVQNQLDGINPVFDAADLPLEVTLESVEVADGAILVKGKVSPPVA